MRQYAIILGLVSAALFMWIAGSEADEISLLDIGVFTVALVGILLIQAALLWLINKLLRAIVPGMAQWILLGVASLLMAANAFFLAFVVLEIPTSMQIAYAAVVGIVFFILLCSAPARVVVALFAACMVLMSLVQYAYARTKFVGDDNVPDTVSLPVKSDRNVYIIGMESLHSPAAYRENYGFEDTPHFKLLRESGFRVLDNAYSAERSTLKSWSNIFEFNRVLLDDSDLGNRGAFINDNSTFKSFRNSGYNVQFIYTSNYLSVNPKYVTYAFPGPKFDACENLTPLYFYGLCYKHVTRRIDRAFFSPPVGYRQQIQHLRERAEVAAKSDKPWLTWTHLRYPFHTANVYRYPDPDYIESFKKRVKDVLPVIAENTEKTAVYISKVDPEAVIIVLGDHGSHLFRGLTKEQVLTDKPVVPVDKVLRDGHGITFAIYPADFCVNRMSESFSSKGLMENLIACLNGNDSPTEEERRRARIIRFEGWDLMNVDDILSQYAR